MNHCKLGEKKASRGLKRALILSKSLPPTLIEDPMVLNFQWKFVPLRLVHTLWQLETLEYPDQVYPDRGYPEWGYQDWGYPD